LKPGSSPWTTIYIDAAMFRSLPSQGQIFEWLLWV
jgi:hypothetical protein